MSAMTTDQRIRQRLHQIALAADFFPGPAFVHDLRTGGIAYASRAGLAALGTTLPALRALGRGFQARYLHPATRPSTGPGCAPLLAPGTPTTSRCRSCSSCAPRRGRSGPGT
ncbi:MAG: hypothetical protein WKG07_48985 [Hymenobacter sp.]